MSPRREVRPSPVSVLPFSRPPTGSPSPYSVRSLALLAVVAIATSLAAAAASAEPATPPAPSAERYTGFDGTPCEKDYNEHCAKNTGVRGAFECVRVFAKRGVGSEECLAYTEQVRKEKLERAIAAQKRWQDACKDDVARLCAEYASEPPKTVKGCLNRKRGELGEACNAELPLRGSYQGPGDARWKDGSEPEDWDLQQAMKNRPRKTSRMLEEQRAEEDRAKKRAEIMAEHARHRAGQAEAAGAAEAPAEAGAPATP